MDQDFDSAEDDQLPAEPQAVIDYIRRIEYGAGANLAGEAALILRKVIRKYGKLLSTVANELNSEDNHFLLELVQNAHDNTYAEGVEPAISFKASAGLLVVENNELGFTPQNVKSLCSAAESTKTDKTMYIGEKGIGFKSVFKVTHAPEVHSNGFHFRFLHEPTDKSGLSYILPHWHEPTLPVREGVTTFILPAKPGYEFGDFNQLTPTLLLFLSKLRLISLAKHGTVTQFRRVDQRGVTRLLTRTLAAAKETVLEERYVRVSVHVSMKDIVEDRRKGVPQSAVVLAFPVLETGKPEVGKLSPVFAFLPVTDYGFRFILHGDFILTSSRESIQEPLAWNRRLRDSIPEAFLSAVETFKASPRLRNTYFHFLPRKGEVKNEFFKSACEKLLAALRLAECVMGESGRWLRPNQVLIADKDFRELVPSEAALELFGLDYPHHEVEADSELLEELGCRHLTIEQVCSLLSTHSSWFTRRSVGWKASFYAYMASLTNQELLAVHLRQRASIPLANGKYIRPGAEPVFFPLRPGPEYGFEDELNVLHPGIFRRAQESNPATRALFAEIGVKTDDPYELIHSHILPRHQESNFGRSTDEGLIAHLRYVKERWSEYKAAAATRGSQASALNTLKSQMYVGSKARDEAAGGWSFELPGALYVSKEYNPAFSLEEVGGEDVGPGLLVSPRYLTEDEATSQGALLSWRVFFNELGINSRPRVQRTPDGDARCAPEVLNLLHSSKKTVRRAVLEAFNNEWASYGEFTRFAATLGRGYANRSTSFIDELRQTVSPTKRRNVFQVCAAYLDCDEVRAFFGDDANYLDARLTSTDFLRTCGVTYRVDAAACLRRLREARSGAKLGRDQLRHILNRIEECWKQDQAAIEQAFRVEPLIPVSFGEERRWFTSAQVAWRSPPSQVRILEELTPSLSSRYSEHQHFFTRQLRIQNELPLPKWVDAIGLLPSIQDAHERRRSATAIYRRLAVELEEREQGDANAQGGTWLPRFTGERLFLTRGGGLVANSPTLFRGDVPELVRLFENSAGVDFLDVAFDQLPKVTAFLDAVKVRTVAESVVWKVASGTKGTVNQALTNSLRSIVPLIARVVYNFGSSRFKSSMERGHFATARRLTVISVDLLEIDANLAGNVQRTPGDVVLEGEHIYVRAGAPAPCDQVARELRKMFLLPESASDIIARLLLCSSEAESEEYLSLVKRIGPLPAEEETHFRTGYEPKESEPDTVNADDAAPIGRAAQGTSLTDTDGAPARSVGGDTLDAYNNPALPHKERPVASRPPAQRNHSREEEVQLSARRALEAPPDSGGTAQPSVGRTSEFGRSVSSGGNDDASSQVSTRTAQPHETAADTDAGLVEKLHEAVDSSGSGSAGALKWDVRQSDSPRNMASRGSSKNRLKRRAGRMVSYAAPSGEGRRDDEQERELQQRRDAIELAAIRCVMQNPEVLARWPKVTEMPPMNPGFDMLGETPDGVTEFIEVKGKGGEWGDDGVALTPRELEKAWKEGERYWLCVVEHALSASPRLYLVQGPYPNIDRFFFDGNWKAKAIAAVPPLSKPAVGLYVTIPGKGKGRIMSVKGTPKMARIHVIFDNGSQAFKLFEPGKMTLSLA